MDFHPILYVVGALLCILGLGMVVPMLVDMAHHNPDWQVFLVCVATTSFFGGTLVLTNAGSAALQLNIRQAFMLTTLSWLCMASFGALPIWLAHENISFADAFFESMSGITTTGATTLVGLDAMPPGILLWRSILNWLGGIGFILMAILLLPFLKVGGMHLFRMESSDKSEKALPRLQKIGKMTGYIYLFLTGLCAFCFWMAGMSGFDAVNHAMSSVATGGFSTHDASFGFFTTPAIHWIAIVFMILGALPFVVYVRWLYGDRGALLNNGQIRTFLGILVVLTVAMTLWLTYNNVFPFFESLRHAAFNIVSLVTTTGFASSDYMLWGTLPVTLFFVMTFLGGCAGSTSGGIKIMRFQVMAEILNRHLHKLQQPNVVFPLRYEGRIISDDVAYSVMVFIFTFLLCLGGLTIALGFCGLDFLTALTGAATSLTNVGPGLGDIIGPAGNFSTIPESAKWILSFGMLLGRLELFTVLILFTPAFWQN